MAQMECIDSKLFLNAGFVVQINEDQFFVAQGPFESVTLQSDYFNQDNGLNHLLIKPQYWDFLSQNPKQFHAYKSKNQAFMTRKEFQDLISNSSTGHLNNLKWSQDFKPQFKAQFQFMQELIFAGTLEKAVPIGLDTAESEMATKPEFFLNQLVLDQSTRGWIYGFWDQVSGFIGRTPELLFQSFPLEDKKISTMALAGTWSTVAGKKNDYLDPKIWNEHQIVVKDIKSQLNELECTLQTETEVVELKNLSHLKTNLEFRYDSLQQLFEVVGELHPTAALGIYPRQQFINQHIQSLPLQFQRGHFGAPLGVIGPKTSHVIVGIRGISWAGPQLSLFAGCGITKDSDFETEYQEICFKMAAVKKMLGLSQG